MGQLHYTKIPKFTGEGHYAVNMPLDHIAEWIAKNEKELGLQLNPDFQRGHVWTELQQIKYIEYLMKGGTSSRDIYFNHPGWMRSFQGEFVCVDGLQRLTAVLRFLNDEIPIFGEYYRKDIIGIPVMNINLIFHVNDLQTRKEVLKWYIEFNSGGTVHTDEELEKVQKLLEKEG